MVHHGSSSKGSSHKGSSHKGSSHKGSSHKGSSHKGSSSKGSSSKGKQPAKDWSWTAIKKFALGDKESNKNLVSNFDDQDFRLARAWLCFVQENMVDDKGTNHVYLKFDFKPSNNHSWKGVKLEAAEDQEHYLRDLVSGRIYTSSVISVDLKDFEGPPRGLRYCVELHTKFNSVLSHGTTLGNLIQLLSGQKLDSFGFSTMTTNKGNNLLIGCRDYIVQVLFSLLSKGFITKRVVKPGKYRKVAFLGEDGTWTWPEPDATFTDIIAALSCFYEEVRGPDREWAVVAASTPVEMGYFPNRPGRVETGNGYPYEIAYKLGCRYDARIHDAQARQGGQ